MHPGLSGRDVLPQGNARVHHLAGGAPEGVLVQREGRLGQRVWVALRATSCEDRVLLEHRLQPGRHQRCLSKSELSEVIRQLISPELGEAPHLSLLQREELSDGRVKHRQQHRAVARPELLGIP